MFAEINSGFDGPTDLRWCDQNQFPTPPPGCRCAIDAPLEKPNGAPNAPLVFTRRNLTTARMSLRHWCAIKDRSMAQIMTASLWGRPAVL